VTHATTERALVTNNWQGFLLQNFACHNEGDYTLASCEIKLEIVGEDFLEMPKAMSSIK
jgi:hypothetical protein